MNLTSRWALRGVLLALAFGMLLFAGPTVATGAGVPQTEPAGSEVPDPDPTTLVLRPVCTAGGLRRFAVEHVAGPATRFTVRVAAGEGAEVLPVAAGATRYFWVDAEQRDPVEIVWSDGSASATPVTDPCAPEPAPSAEPAPEPSAAPAPSPRADPAPPRRPGMPPPPVDPEVSQAPAAPSTPDERSPAPGASRTAPSGDDRRDATDLVPRPQPSGAAFVCPDGWIPVDSDGDGRVEASDQCEVIVETAADAQPAGTTFTTAVLIVTVGLLIASIAAGAVRRRRV